MKGLKLEPGWRQAWVTWLNLLRPKSNPPTRDAHRAVLRVDGNERRFGLGQLQHLPASFSSFLMRIIAPRRIRLFGGALSSSMRAANFRPSPLMVDRFPAPAPGAHLARACLQHQRGENVVAVRVVGERLLVGLLGLGRVAAARRSLPGRGSRGAGRSRAARGAPRRRRLPGPPCGSSCRRESRGV